MIESTDWDRLINNNDINVSLLNWEQQFMHIMNESIPKGTLPKRQNLPWLSKNLIQAMRKRNYLYRRAKRTGVPRDMGQYRTARNKTVTMLRNAKKAFFNKLNTADKKQFWKTMKYLWKEQNTIPVLSHNGSSAHNDNDKANMLNNLFSQCFNTKLPPLTPRDCHRFTTSGECPENILCTEEEIIHLLQNIDVSKSSGPDRISGRMLKGTAHSIAPSITKIFNMSITLGCFPQTWKLSNVVPIPKSADNTSPTNYRPISLLSVLSKLLERRMYSQITSHLETHHPLSTSQWGFQSGRSTVTALLETTHNWFQFMDTGKEVGAVFFDLQKAFDSVPHHALLDKLRDLQLSEFILKWICDYLTQRKQRVVVNGQTSETLPVLSGVPQGSVIGPLLFLIYIDGMMSVPLSQGSQLTVYADDILLYRPITCQGDFIALQEDINILDAWIEANYLQFNISKCKYMVVSRKRAGISPASLTLQGNHLERVECFKYLGLLLTPDLSWSTHVDSICSKARKLLGLLYRKYYQYAEPQILLQLYVSLVRPHLEYASPVYGTPTCRKTSTL